MTKSKQNKKIRALVLFSGGLDSRLVVKLLQEQGIIPLCLQFRFLFGEGCCNNQLCSFKFCQKQGVELKIIDCTKGKLFRDYIATIKQAKHGIGSGANPCIDCRLFIIKHAKTLIKKLKCSFIATGEVLGERPMSQHKQAMNIIEKDSGLHDQILRPLSAKLLQPTQAEKQKLVDRNKLLDISGRNRKPQIALAKKFKITYPHPAGGCLLCEKEYAKRLRDLFKHIKIKDIKPEHIQSIRKFRHFRRKSKIVLGKNHQENLELERLNNKLRWHIITPTKPGPTAIFENSDDKNTSNRLIEAYSTDDIKLRKKFEKFKI